jgi:alkanesulfonate monooxygenase SsuD/methylene tetrahydromethanopterin reductase-like flavin-dependent oxidoreductase (luciferase family)
MPNAVKLGYLLPTRERIMVGEHRTRPILDLARHAEAVGFDAVWIGDSVTAKPRHDALSMLAAIGAVTEKVFLGTAVLLPMLRNPVLLAHQAATIDQISEGRLILGVGTARDVPAIRHEFEATGTPFDKRIGRMLEGLQLAKALWAGCPVDWDGRWKVEQAEVAPLPHRKGGPPLWSGGSAEGALKRAGRYFDGWFPSGPSDASVYARNLAQVLGYAEEAGRDPAAITRAIYLTIAIDEDAAKAETALNSYLERYYNLPAETLRHQQAGFAGPKAAAADWIASFIEAGCRHICIRTVGGDREQMERIMEMRGEFDDG